MGGPATLSSPREGLREANEKECVFSLYSELVRQSLGPSGSNNLAQAAAQRIQTRLPAPLRERRIECGHSLQGGVSRERAMHVSSMVPKQFVLSTLMSTKCWPLRAPLGLVVGIRPGDCNDAGLPMVGSVAVYLNLFWKLVDCSFRKIKIDSLNLNVLFFKYILRSEVPHPVILFLQSSSQLIRI